VLKIEAIFRPERVNTVVAALLEAGVTGLHYQNITGQGRQQGVEVVTGRGGSTTRSAVPKTLLVTVIPDDKKDVVVDAIVASTRSGEIGDGKIFITAVDDVLRVRTGEHGEAAL
jgi:nitrogen regulatory protein PII